MKYHMLYCIRYHIRYSMYCHHPKRPANLPERFFMTGYSIMLKLPPQSFFFLDCTSKFVSLHVPLGHVPKVPWNTQFASVHHGMASDIACLSLQHHGIPFYPLYSHGEANCRLHRWWTQHNLWCLHHCTGQSSFSSTMHIWIKTAYSTQNGTVVTRGLLHLVRESAQFIGSEAMTLAIFCVKNHRVSQPSTLFTRLKKWCKVLERSWPYTLALGRGLLKI